MLPSLLFVRSSVTSPALTSATYNTWYDTVHIPELLAIPGGPRKAHRYQSTHAASERWKFLTLYPLDDIAFTSDPTIQEEVSAYHPILPEGKSIWELVGLDGRDYLPDGDDQEGLMGTARSIVTVEGSANDRLPIPDGVRCTRYKIHRAPTAMMGADSAQIDVPRDLMIYELDRREDMEGLVESLEKMEGINEWSSWEALP